MADKQNQNKGQGNGGSAQGQVREVAQQTAQRVREGAEQLGEQVQGGLSTARDEAARRFRQTEGMIARHPGSSVMTSFGLGLGLGVALGLLLSQQRERSWYDRYMPDSLRDLPDQLRHIPERLRHYGEAVAERMPGR